MIKLLLLRGPFRPYVPLHVATSVFTADHREIKLKPGTKLHVVGQEGRNLKFILDGEVYSIPDGLTDL